MEDDISIRANLKIEENDQVFSLNWDLGFYFTLTGDDLEEYTPLAILAWIFHILYYNTKWTQINGVLIR